MSKSNKDSRSRILITDSPDEIRQKIKGALTDSLPGITYDRVNRPGMANLLEILTHLERQSDGGDASPSPDALAKEFENEGGIQRLKERVADKTVERLHGIRDRFEYWMSEERSKYLDDVAAEGAKTARNQAASTMRRVRNAIGT